VLYAGLGAWLWRRKAPPEAAAGTLVLAALLLSPTVHPWYAGWHKNFATKGLTVIGVHTPETAEEAKLERVLQKVKANGMEYPIAVDGSSQTWKAWGNRYWPGVYLIDKQGNVRYRWDGELNWKDTKGEEIMRKKIEELLAEKD